SWRLTLNSCGTGPRSAHPSSSTPDRRVARVAGVDRDVLRSYGGRTAWPGTRPLDAMADTFSAAALVAQHAARRGVCGLIAFAKLVERDQPHASGVERVLGATLDPQLAEDVTHVGLDRLFGDAQVACDLLVGGAVCQRSQDVCLALGQG